MSKRSCVRDYYGNEIYAGDLVCYASRQGNTVRMSDAIVLKTFVKRFDGRILPYLRVRPTGSDSGMVPRRSHRIEEVSTTHVRLVMANVMGEQQ